MKKKLAKTNNELLHVIDELLKSSSVNKAPIWKAVANELKKPRRRSRVVNLSKINRFANDDDVVVVPGKVLGSGYLSQKVVIAAYSFSKQAREKIEKSNGKAVSLLELVRKYPTGRDVKIIG